MDNSTMKELTDHYRQQGAPGDQQMLIILLKEAQEADGGVLAKDTINGIAGIYGLKEAVLMALIKRIPALRYEDVPHKLEICMTCKCGGDIRRFVEQQYSVMPGGISREGGFSYRTVNCMKNCKNGPSVKWDGVLYSKVDIRLLKSLIDQK